MFSKKGSLPVTKGKPLFARQQTVEVKASSTGEFMKAEKFEKSEQGGSSACNFIYSAAAVQGFRSRMQDDYVCTPNVTIKGSPYGFFGVFDGHGENGEIISQFCADNILNQLLQRKAMRHSKVVTNELLAASVHKTLIKLDGKLRGVGGDTQTGQFVYGGTTACCVLISQDDIMFVNVGDSRAVLCRDGGVVFETKDHNPDVPEEEERITAAGGHVHTTPSKQKIITDKDGFNNLCVSRTIGDFNFKHSTDLPPELQPVTAAPEINVVSRDLTKDEFLVIASDGIYKSLSSTQVVQFVLRQLMITDDLTKICRNLIDTAYFAVDNIPDDTTVILIKFSAAPSISQQAIAEERQLDVEATAAVEREVKVIIGRAGNIKAVDNDFGIIQMLVQKLPEKYRVQERVAFVVESTARLRREKFGVSNNGQSLPKNTSTPSQSVVASEKTMKSVSQSDSSKQASVKKETQNATTIEYKTTVSTDSEVDRTVRDSSDLTVDNPASQDATGEDLIDKNLNDGSATGDDSAVETGESVKYCMTEISEGEVKEQETLPLSANKS